MLRPIRTNIRLSIMRTADTLTAHRSANGVLLPHFRQSLQGMSNAVFHYVNITIG